MRESDLTEQIIDGAIEVHKHWGPGLYEEIYERSLYHELRTRKVAFESQVKLPLLREGGCWLSRRWGHCAMKGLRLPGGVLRQALR
jgi:hypothetical protein